MNPQLKQKIIDHFAKEQRQFDKSVEAIAGISKFLQSAEELLTRAPELRTAMEGYMQAVEKINRESALLASATARILKRNVDK